jgi:hypothetical protein
MLQYQRPAAGTKSAELPAERKRDQVKEKTCAKTKAEIRRNRGSTRRNSRRTKQHTNKILQRPRDTNREKSPKTRSGENRGSTRRNSRRPYITQTKSCSDQEIQTEKNLRSQKQRTTHMIGKNMIFFIEIKQDFHNHEGHHPPLLFDY